MSRISNPFLSAMLLVAWLAGVDPRPAPGQQKPAPPPQSRSHGHATGHEHGDHEHAPVPPAYAEAHIPPDVWTDASLIMKGREIFVAKCALCHGQNGDGKGPGAAGLPLKPPDLRDGRMFAEMSGNYMVWRVSEGGRFIAGGREVDSSGDSAASA